MFKKFKVIIVTIAMLFVMVIPAHAEDTGWIEFNDGSACRYEGNLQIWRNGRIVSLDVNAPGHWEQYNTGYWKFLYDDGYEHYSQWLKFNGEWYFICRDDRFSGSPWTDGWLCIGGKDHPYGEGSQWFNFDVNGRLIS